MPFPANFDKRVNAETPAPAPYRPDSVISIPDEHLLKQKAIDDGMIAALAVGRLIQRSPQTGKHEVADSYWAISRARVETTPGEGSQVTCEIVGGWVTKEQAILELAEPAEPILAAVTDLEARQAA